MRLRLWGAGVMVLMSGLLLGIAPAVQAAYFNANDTDASLNENVSEDAFLAGRQVNVSGAVAGELFAFGNNVSITQKNQRSVAAAGNNVTVERGSGYNAYVAGSMVTLGGTFEHDVYAAGETVILKDGTEIKGDLYVAGSRVVLAGTVGGDVKFAARTLESGAVIAGTLNGSADNITFTGGRVGGDFVYTMDKDASGLDKVEITGKTERNQPRRDTTEARRLYDPYSLLYSVFSLLLLGAFLIWLTPRQTTEVIRTLNKEWKQAFIWGLVGLILVPVAAVVLLFTIIGWKVVVVAMALYVTLLILASAYGLIWIGNRLVGYINRNKPAMPWAQLILGVVAVSLISAVPYIGWLVSLLVFFGATLPAFGALLRWWKECSV